MLTTCTNREISSSTTIAKRVLKAQEMFPLLPDGHVKRHDLLSPSSMPIKEVCLSNNVTSGIADSTSNKPEIVIN